MHLFPLSILVTLTVKLAIDCSFSELFWGSVCPQCLGFKSSVRFWTCRVKEKRCSLLISEIADLNFKIEYVFIIFWRLLSGENNCLINFFFNWNPNNTPFPANFNKETNILACCLPAQGPVKWVRTKSSCSLSSNSLYMLQNFSFCIESSESDLFSFKVCCP